MKRSNSKLEDPRRFRIRHPSFGYFLSIKRTEFDGCRYHEEFTHERSKAPFFSLAEVRRPMNANNDGLMTILVSGYTGIFLEEVSGNLKSAI